MPSNAIPPWYDSFDTGFTGTRAVFNGGFTVTGGRLRESATGADNAGGMTYIYNDQYSEVTVATFNTNAKACAGVRMSTGWNAYLLFAELATTSIFMLKVVTGSFTTLGTAAGVTFSVPFKLRLEVIGSTLYGYHNGTQLYDPIVDTALVSGAPGYYLTGATNVANQELEDFEGGPLSACSYSPRRHPQASAQPVAGRNQRMR